VRQPPRARPRAGRCGLRARRGRGRRGQGALELGLGLVGRVGLEDAALGLDDLPERPEGDPLPVGEAAALPPANELPGAILEVAEELRAEPALAHPRLAHDRDQLAGALLRRALEGADQQRPLELPADERCRTHAGHVRAEAGAGGERAVEGERLGFSLHLHGLELLVVEDALGLPVRLLRDRDPVHRCCTLQAGGGVDDVAGDDSLPLLGTGAQRDDRLAGVDPDPDLKRECWVLLVQLRDRLQNPQPSADGTLRVVLVRCRSPKHRHHRIPDKLLHRPPVALDLSTQPLVIRPQPRPHILRIHALRRRREPDQIAEQNRDHLPLLLDRRSRLLDQRCGAEAAEGEPLRILPPTTRTGHHRPSLGQPPATHGASPPRGARSFCYSLYVCYSL
jgi:hypothetical protein